MIGNRIQNFTAPFNDVTVLNQVLEVTEGFSKGSRFFIYDFNATTLFCTGLLNNYPVNLEAAGVELTADDVARIDALDREDGRLGPDPAVIDF